MSAKSASDGPILFDATLAHGGTLKIAGPRLYAQVSDIANVDVRASSRMLAMTCTAAAGVILTGTAAIFDGGAGMSKPSRGS